MQDDEALVLNKRAGVGWEETISTRICLIDIHLLYAFCVNRLRIACLAQVTRRVKAR